MVINTAQLYFFEKSHEYRVDDEIIPSVSEIIRFISREIYNTVEQYTLDNAAERGKYIHKACESLDKFGSIDCDERYVGYIKAYLKFLEENKVEWQEIEKPYFHPELKYAGTLDRVGLVNKKKAIVDIKSSSVIQKVLCGAQLNGYYQAYETNRSNAHPIETLYILHLHKDETYKLIEFEIDSTSFMSCLILHNLLKKKPRKKKIGANENE